VILACRLVGVVARPEVEHRVRERQHAWVQVVKQVIVSDDALADDREGVSGNSRPNALSKP
jgi:hypothetical protein